MQGHKIAKNKKCVITTTFQEYVTFFFNDYLKTN